MRLHCMQGLSELRLLREWYGRHPLDVLESVGLLGPQAAHPARLYLGAPETPFEGIARPARRAGRHRALPADHRQVRRRAPGLRPLPGGGA
ncbi:hypothetical protein [Nonomuraea dietziae]|uniref:hypothetical protein n=1 Tax=Nonomuraea dietziae TaxID=65515 RepID=UPI0031DE08FE